ncbi:MAG: hypothetical protein ACP5NK_06880 [Thermoplasmata archaeon]
MWSSEVLDQCAVIRLGDRYPREVRTKGRNIALENNFFFTSFDNGILYTYRNLETTLSEIDKLNLEKSPEFKRSRISILENSVLRIRTDDDLLAPLNRINDITGCRVNPNILSHSQDAYVQIEFSENVREQVSKLLLQIMSAMPSVTELIYMGKQPDSMPYLMKLFAELGGNINDLFLVRTEWHMKQENRERENSGIFMNEGKFIPKYCTNAASDILIFRLKSTDIRGNPQVREISSETGAAELGTQTTFFSDFYNEVVSTYFGTLFYEAEVNGNILTSYYVIDRKLSSLFLSGLKRHWNLPKRKEHYNIITSAMSLGALFRKP